MNITLVCPPKSTDKKGEKKKQKGNSKTFCITGKREKAETIINKCFALHTNATRS